jgi:hypothetical protein
MNGSGGPWAGGAAIPDADFAAARSWLANFLDEIGAGATRHSGRTLRDHLLGTFDLLQAWGCRLEVCIAGGLHSIYGTNAFQARCVSAQDRPAIAALVGSGVDRMVDLFHRADRPRAILEGFASEQLIDRFCGRAIPVCQAELKELLSIECANLIEQEARSGLLHSLSRLPRDVLREILPAGAVREVACAAREVAMTESDSDANAVG